MKRWKILTIVVAALAAVAAPLHAADEDASREKRLADAQRRLEDAAREVAELSGEAAGPGGPLFDYFIGAPRRRAMLGVNLGGAEQSGGARVASVSPGGPAAKAGVEAGDVIVAMKGEPVATGRELVRAMESIEPGEEVELGIRRDGKPLKLTVEARAYSDPRFFTGPAVAGVRAMPPFPAIDAAPLASGLHWLLQDWGDAEFITLTPGLGRYFGTDKGVLVARAPTDAAFGLQDGDVIVAIGGREPQNGPHAMRILRSYQPGESVELRILRERRSQTLSAKIPEGEPRDVLRRALPPPAAPPAPLAPPAPPAPPESAAST